MRILAAIAGFAGAVLLHAIWNTATVYGPGNFVIVYLILMAPIFLAGVLLVVGAMSHHPGRH